MIQKLLERISWKTRRWKIRVNLLDIYLHDHHGTWGFGILNASIGLYEYSLLAFECRLPNKTSVRKFSIDHWDILFLRRPLWKMYDDLSESQLWNPRSLSKLDRFKLRLLNRLFK